MNTGLIRFRIDMSIMEKAVQMSAALGMELPDAMRLLLTRAVRKGDFEFDKDDTTPPAPGGAAPFEAYAGHRWKPLTSSLLAEAATELLHRAIAERTTLLDEGLRTRKSDPERVARLERLRDERDEACQLLAKLDPDDGAHLQQIIETYSNDNPHDGGAS